jgi:hypothetical protein
VSRALIEAYIEALPLTAVAIVSSADGRRCRIHTDGEPAPGETIERRLYFKPSHAELVLSTIDLEGWIVEQPAAAVALIERTAENAGAPYQTPDELRKVAEEAVAELTARIDAGRQNGDLKQVNRQYKLYRQQEIAKAEKARGGAGFWFAWLLGAVLINELQCAADCEVVCCSHGRPVNCELGAADRAGRHEIGLGTVTEHRSLPRQGTRCQD